MSKTKNVGLPITTLADSGEKFLDWQQSINGEGPDSAFNIIDEKFGSVVGSDQGEANAGKALIVGVDGKVTTGEAGVSVDTTLKVAGKAADAKATGDAIANALGVYIGDTTPTEEYKLWINPNGEETETLYGLTEEDAELINKVDDELYNVHNYLNDVFTTWKTGQTYSDDGNLVSNSYAVASDDKHGVDAGTVLTLKNTNYNVKLIIYDNDGNYVSTRQSESKGYVFDTDCNVKIAIENKNAASISTSAVTKIISINHDVSRVRRMERLVEGINLFNRDDVIEHYRLLNDGRLYSEDISFVTKFIPVDGSTLYTKIPGPWNLWHRIIFYDANKGIISEISNLMDEEFITPENARYVRFTAEMEELDSSVFMRGGKNAEVNAVDQKARNMIMDLAQEIAELRALIAAM